MASNRIAEAVKCAWKDEAHAGRQVLDLSVGSGQTARMLTELGFDTVATEYSKLPFIAENVPRVAGVNLIILCLSNLRNWTGSILPK